MKKVALLIIAMLMLDFTAQAQSIFTEGTTAANIGLGIGGTLFDGGFNALLPPLSVEIDHSVTSGLFDDNGSIGVGDYLGAEVYHYRGFDNSIWSQTLVGPRGSLHYQFIDRSDTYFDLMLGINIISWSYSMKMADNTVKDEDTATGFGWGAYVGTRYYLSDRWAVMGRLGCELALLTLGAIYRF